MVLGLRLPKATSDLYKIVRYWHPDSGKPVEVMRTGLTLVEAQAYCQSPASEHREGPTSEWWFDGYARQDSTTYALTLW